MLKAIMGVRSTSERTMAAKTVLVLKDNAGVALDPFLVGPAGPAILEAWFPGQKDGDIVADLLAGRASPSGRLPVTFPIAGRGFLDAPAPAQFPSTLSPDGRQTVTYPEGSAIGYRWYDSNPGGSCSLVRGRNPCVALPFGHGPSYTRFAVRDARLLSTGPRGPYRVEATVADTGPRPGAQVVQVYLALPAAGASTAAPPRRLVGFARVELAPGASRAVAVTVDPRAGNHPIET